MKQFREDRIYISLGWNCYPREIVVAHMNERKVSDGYHSCPFDLMGSYYPALCELFNNDFEDMYNPEFLKINETDTIINTKYGFTFRHESSNHFGILGTGEGWKTQKDFTENNFEKFIKRY